MAGLKTGGRPSMANKSQGFLILQESVNISGMEIDTSNLVSCVAESNAYLNALHDLFDELSFDLFRELGQRNISGVVGEVFVRYLCRKCDRLEVNPHPDGRPDALYLPDTGARDYFLEECFYEVEGRRMPVKSRLTPFRYGGVEVKCTIGAPMSGYKEDLKRDTGRTSFDVGTSRIKYVSRLGYWAHHAHSANLLGLYYDYYPEAQYRPQILAVLYAQLGVGDWHVVSVGSVNAKKTSNTSLNAAGVEKLYRGCLLIRDDQAYIEKFKSMGVRL